MRFKKGSKVEVLCKKDMALGAWRGAEIISGNGHTYCVRYAAVRGMEDGKTVDKVPRTSIRPCPPPVGSVVNWASGDIVEVLDAGSWKAAIVLKVLDGGSCLVRLLGSFMEFKIHKSKTRPRRTWQDDKWVVFGKGCGSREAAKSNNLPNLNCCDVPQVNARIRLPAGNDGLALQDNNYGQDSYIVSAKSLKRASPFCSSQVEAHPSKVRAIQKWTDHQQVISRSPSPLLKKVDAVASPRDNLGENGMHASFSKQTNGHFEIERENLIGASSCFFERSTEFSDSDSGACSVGSCSVSSSGMNKFPSIVLAGPSQDADAHSSDAESFCGREDEEENCSLPLKEEGASRIHRLELHAYRSTMVAMHASGPLSWEQEALLTNLRITLHISNDEHLIELRNLISSRKPKCLLAYDQ
ncbi:uncharacterized protein LOC21389071 isoform X1 [Morus notabilis]|uniref:uncharacterized protein LOC21389071 isoform X1 n=1 Tax=Morus notabilis TaxID=981085 RepID=UPI000CED7DC6|nr:uncharacterized protein LOC21389071 isoform X1 [Morus notabilis]